MRPRTRNIVLALVSLGAAILPLHAQSRSQPPHTIAAANFHTLEEMEAACGTQPCLVAVTTHRTIQLSRPHSIPARIVLHFERGGQWEMRGAELTITGGIVEAPEDARIFTGDTFRILGLTTARPEWFADPTPEGYPASALAEAYRATTPGSSILLREAAYISPFFNPYTLGLCDGSPVSYTSPRVFQGTRRPTLDDEQTPQKLQSGTILRGGICGSTALIARHLGLDEGPFVVDHLFGGRGSYGISLGRQGALHETKGTVLDDIAVLTTAVPDQHSVIIQGQDDVTIRGLWLWTLGGTHGLVVKSSHSTVRDFHCKGASSDCLIVKSDAATDNSGYASDVLLDGIDISSLHHEGDTGGIVLDSRWDSVHHITFDHVTERGTSYGINGSGSIFHTLHDIAIRNWNAEGITYFCLNAGFSRDIEISHFQCRITGNGSPAHAMTLAGERSHLSDGTIGCTTGVPPCGGGLVDGIADLGTATTLDHIAGDGLTGYLLRNIPGQAEVTANLTARAMNARLQSPYQAPPETLQSRTTRWIATTKPDLRILWTATATRIAVMPSLIKYSLVILALLFLLSLPFHLRR